MRNKIFALSLTAFLILALVPMALAGNGEQDKTNAFCGDLTGRQHPVGGRLAKVYDVPYETLMGWFCVENYGFGEILLALQTSKITDAKYSAEQLLHKKTELGGWGEVWKDIGFTGRPKGGHPAWAGPKGGEDEGVETGPPDWAGPKNREEEGESGPPPWAGPPSWAGPKGKGAHWKTLPED